MSMDDEFRAAYRAHLKTQNDRISREANAEARGIALGEARGIALGKEEGIALGEARGIALGEERGIALGKEEGIALGEERGIALGKQEGIALGEERGIALGKQEGKQEEKRETARNLLSMGLSLDQIANATGLSIEEIEALKNK
jgi:predicted transposase YdaD